MIIHTLPRPTPTPGATPAPPDATPTPPPPTPPPDVILERVTPIAINDQWKAPTAQPSATPAAAPTPVAAPQILSWDGAALIVRERQEDNSWFPFGLEEMIPSMDGWEYLEPKDMNDNGIIVGYGWFTDPKNPSAGGESHGFALVPLGFQARDSKMIGTWERGVASKHLTFQPYWLKSSYGASPPARI